MGLRLRDIQNGPRACFYVTISGNVKNVNILTLRQTFRKTKTIFKKLDYRFLVESNKNKNASFPYKTTITEANVKTNRMVATKLTYHKEQSFASN